MKNAAQHIGRRRFLKAVPATVAAGVALPSVVSTPVAAQRGGGATPPRVGKDALKGAEQIAGLSFTDAEEEAAVGGVSRNLDAYEQLRKIDVPLDGAPIDPTVLRRRAEERNKLLKEALDVMRAQGAKLEPMTLPDFPANSINFILDAEAAAAFDDLTRSGDANQMTNSSWPNSFRTSRFIPAVEYIRAQRARTLLIRQMDAAMAKFDVFLSPSGGNSLGLTNLTGHPAACLKAGFVDGLPQALMVTGRLYDEATVLRVALAYERATKWHTMNPTLDENLRKMTTQAPVEN